MKQKAKKEMHPHVKMGNELHFTHFKTVIRDEKHLAPGWKLLLVNEPISNLDRLAPDLRPDWVLINWEKKKAYVIDLTSKYSRRHYKKGLLYVSSLKSALKTLPNFLDSEWEFIYIEDYWLDAVLH